MDELINNMRSVINKQSKVISQMSSDIEMMKFVLGYEEKKQNFDVFFKVLESQGISMGDAMKRPDLMSVAMRSLRK